MEYNLLIQSLDDCINRTSALRDMCHIDDKQKKLTEVTSQLEDPNIWNDQALAQRLGKERVALEKIINKLVDFAQFDDLKDLAMLAHEEGDEASIADLATEFEALSNRLDKAEFERMFSGEMDPNAAYVDINSGSGGTEAQDWAEMLLRMYLRWAERRGFKSEIIEISPGEVAGIKSATIRVDGDYAFGWLRTETGVHRLVRKSPFDSGSRRHTSFASVFISPEISDDIDIEINPADCRVDTYRASGAGGQHVNRTDSAVRITHAPSGIVVQCQSDRSQHRNRDQAMKQLKAKLYESEIQKREEKQKATEETKSDIGWGSQIRSYVLDQSRIKDLRTNVEVGDTQRVLDGDLDGFMEAMLKQGDEA